MKSYFNLTESLTRNPISKRNIQSDKIKRSSLGYKDNPKVVSGDQESLGYRFRKSKMADPFAIAQRQRDRDVRKKARQVGYVKEMNFFTFRESLNEATFKGKKVPLNKPMAGDVKKSKVFVDPDGDGKAQKVNFGDKSMTIKKHIPSRRKSFRARHNCDDPGPKTKARYWSCKAW